MAKTGARRSATARGGVAAAAILSAIATAALLIAWIAAAAWLGSASRHEEAAAERLEAYRDAAQAAELLASVAEAQTLGAGEAAPAALDRALRETRRLSDALARLRPLDGDGAAGPALGALAAAARDAARDLDEFMALPPDPSAELARVALGRALGAAWSSLPSRLELLVTQARAADRSARDDGADALGRAGFIGALAIGAALSAAALLGRRALRLAEGLRRTLAAVEAATAGGGASHALARFGAEFEAVESGLKTLAARIAEANAARATAEAAPFLDADTGLANRRGALRKLADNGAQAALHIDLDRFRDINERLGRAAGDALLREAALAVAAAAPGFIAARISSDEFALIAQAPTPIAALEAAATAAQAAVARVGAAAAARHGDASIALSASVGVATQVENAPPDRLLADAELAAQHAKREGRGRVAFCSPSLRNRARQRDSYARDLARAIAEDEIEPFFQPQISISDGRVVGLEAFARWRHPTRGLLPPAAIFQQGEGVDLSDLLDEVDDVIARKALRAIGVLGDAGWRAPYIAVNVSGRRLENPRLVDRLGWLLDETGQTPDRLRLEVMAQDLRADGAELGARRAREEVAARLLGAGFRIDLDDFGVGGAEAAKAAAQTLKKLGLDRVKLDRSFVADIDAQAAKRRAAEALISYAAALGAEVVAEGVERAAERDALTALGCDIAQGHLIARPMPLDELVAWMAQLGVLGARAA